MLIRDRMAHKRLTFSFEVRSMAAGEDDAAWRTVEQLAPLEPDFVVIACDSRRLAWDRTLALSRAVKRALGIEPLVRLGCDEGHDDLARIIDQLADADLCNVLVAGPNMFDAATVLREAGTFCVACEVGPHAFDPQQILQAAHAGVDFFIAPIGLDNAAFHGLMQRAREQEIQLPILPGILPVTHPVPVGERFDGTTDDPQDRFWTGISHAARQCRDLLQPPRSDPFLHPMPTVPGIHFYTLNNSLAGRALFELLRLADPCRGDR